MWGPRRQKYSGRGGGQQAGKAGPCGVGGGRGGARIKAFRWSLGHPRRPTKRASLGGGPSQHLRVFVDDGIRGCFARRISAIPEILLCMCSFSSLEYHTSMISWFCPKLIFLPCLGQRKETFVNKARCACLRKHGALAHTTIRDLFSKHHSCQT